MRQKILKENYDEFQEILKETTTKQGKKPCVVAVSKTYPTEDILSLYQLGQHHFGENKVQELLEKENFLNQFHPEINDLHWHYIGHLQTNKIKSLLKVRRLKFIHSLDSLEKIKLIFNNEALLRNQVSFFIQYNTSNEDQKQGVKDKNQLFQIIQELKSLGHFEEGQLFSPLKKLLFLGLMTISANPRGDDHCQKEARASFQQLYDLKYELERNFSFSPLQLSMGMSQDYPFALEFQTGYIRIGTSLFGERN